MSMRMQALQCLARSLRAQEGRVPGSAEVECVSIRPAVGRAVNRMRAAHVAKPVTRVFSRRRALTERYDTAVSARDQLGVRQA